ncbi:hemagglutinin repeat-containing protein [Pseudomonas sp. HR1]|uniref:hemagglutinin repeat-containing protein n=1 Tax=Pseudomonas sp. HR1 TaxID=1463361 RepID=UPI0032EECCCF
MTFVGDLIVDHDVNLVSAKTQTGRSSGANNTSSSITQLTGSLTAGRDLGIGAGRDLTAVASTLSAGGNAILTAQDNLTLAAAADETHSYSKSKKVTRQEDHVDQQITTLTAGGNVSLVAKQGDLTMIASKVEAGNEAYLYAGKDLNVLAAQDSDYSLYDMKKKGSFGAKKTQRDEVTDVRNIGSEIKAGGDITLQSEGSQTYRAAKLTSGKNLTLDSGGDITFEAVKDLHQESHEKSSNSLAWTSMRKRGQIYFLSDWLS